MPNIAIQIENLSKQYRLGTIGTGTLSHDLKRWWIMNIQGKEDPNLRIGGVNDRAAKADSDFVWALKNINLEIEQGDIVGIIGKNGAGKSTLLKILSRVTSPSTGTVKYKGRMASLLEVGTGFHWEMTGRENIFMNGSIMGMTRAEIRGKLDEIIEFAGVEKYIDTPVKRYSSGMIVRLGFSVAAHLEPEILIVDEVLAVGDAEFQKKALGKMQDVSKGEGRTVLFVSHNMESIIKLCKRGILIHHGVIEKDGEADDVVKHYTGSNFGVQLLKEYRKPGTKGHMAPVSVFVHDENFQLREEFDVKEKIGVTCKYEIFDDKLAVIPGFKFHNINNVNLFDVHENISENKLDKEAGVYTSTVWIPGNFFNEGMVSVDLGFLHPNPFFVYFFDPQVLAFQVTDDGNNITRGFYNGPFPGLIRPALKWETIKMN